MFGGMVCCCMVYDCYKNKRMNTNSKKGSYYYTSSFRFFWKMVCGMFLYKIVCGVVVFECFKVYEGILVLYDKVKCVVVLEAFKVLRFGEGYRFCVFGDFCE